MLIWVKTNMGNFTIQNMNKVDTIKELKLEVLKKMILKVPRIKNISVNRLRLRNNSGITLLNDHTLEKSNVRDNTTLLLDINMGAFGEVKKPEINGEYFDINEFIYYMLDTDDIVFVSWGNAITNLHIMREHRSSKYPEWHNVFRQQLPIPLLEHAVNVNKDINIFSIDKGFESITEYDIRIILEDLIKQRKGVHKIRIGNIDRYSLNTCILLDELGINCVYTDSIVNLYFIPEIYGYCDASGDKNDIQLCLLDLSIKLNNLGVEYFIYGQPLDIGTLITNNLNIGNNIKDWFQIDQRGGKRTMKKKRNMRGGTGDNEEISLLKNKLEECENKNEICCGDMDKAAENIQRVTRGHQGRNTFKQKRRSMKPNVTDTLLDMPTDFGSMIMDKIPEAREEQKIDKQINLLRRYIGELVSGLEYREAGANKTDADILGEVAEMAADRDLHDQNTHTDLEYLSWLKKLRETNRVYIPLYLKNIENMKEVIKRRNLQEIIKVITHYQHDSDEFADISQQLAYWPGADAGRVLAYAKIKMSLFDEWWSSDREDSWTHMVNQYFSRDVLPRYV
jgi:hypothetical protein